MNIDRFIESEELRNAKLKLDFLDAHLFGTFQYSTAPHPQFEERLNGWLDNVDSSIEKEEMYLSLLQLVYIGPQEFNTAQIYAYEAIYKTWVIDSFDFYFDEPKLDEKFIEKLKVTWFSPLSDSADIKGFLRRNHIDNIEDLNIDWRSLLKLVKGNNPLREMLITSYRDIFRKKGIEVIVLVEDFVGSGDTVSAVLGFLREISDEVKILVIPLVICPKALERKEPLDQKYNADIKPVCVLDQKYFVSEQDDVNIENGLSNVKKIAYDTFSNVSYAQRPKRYVEPYHYLGYEKTGGLVVLFSNTPNNTLPYIHNYSEKWNPLFPRQKRA